MARLRPGPPARSHRRGAGGLSLIEVVVALTVLGVGILALVGASSAAARVARAQRAAADAALLAGSRADRLRVRAIGHDTCPFGPGDSAAGPREAWSLEPEGGLATLRVVVRGPAGRADTLVALLPCAAAEPAAPAEPAR